MIIVSDLLNLDPCLKYARFSPRIEENISGVIMYEETVDQATAGAVSSFAGVTFAATSIITALAFLRHECCSENVNYIHILL